MADHEETSSPLLSTRSYDIVKFLAQVLFPALGTAYAAVAVLWHFDEWNVQVLGTIAAIDTLLAVLLGVSKSSFQKAGGDGTITADGTVAFNSPDVLAKDTIVLTKGNASSVPPTFIPGSGSSQ